MTRQSVRVGIHQAEPGSGLSSTARAHYRDAGVEIDGLVTGGIPNIEKDGKRGFKSLGEFS